MLDPLELLDFDQNSLDDVESELQSFLDILTVLYYISEFIGTTAVLCVGVVILAMQIKEHHWQLRRFTNSVPSTFVSNATRRSNVWVKLHYSDDALPSDLKKSPSLRTLKKHGFECVGAGDAIKLQMERFSLNLFVSVFVESDALETATPIALLHPLAIRQSLIVTKEKTIALMSADNPSVDSEGNFHRTARSIVSYHYVDQNKSYVFKAVKSFWMFVDSCLWRCDAGIFSSRPKLSFANRSGDFLWVHCGLQSLAELECEGDLESVALFGLTRIAPWSSIVFYPYQGGRDATQTLKMHVDVFRGRHLTNLTWNEAESHVLPLIHVSAGYSSDATVTCYEEAMKKTKEKMNREIGWANFGTRRREQPYETRLSAKETPTDILQFVPQRPDVSFRACRTTPLFSNSHDFWTAKRYYRR